MTMHYRMIPIGLLTKLYVRITCENVCPEEPWRGRLVSVEVFLGLPPVDRDSVVNVPTG